MALRLATRDEAYFIDMTGGYADDGPILGPTNWLAVPVDYSLFSEDDAGQRRPGPDDAPS